MAHLWALTSATVATWVASAYECRTDVSLGPAMHSDRKGIALDDNTLRWCSSQIPDHWPNADQPMTSIRLFKAWDPFWNDWDRTAAWTNLEAYVRRVGAKVFIGTQITCDEAADEKAWAWTKDFMRRLSPEHVMGLAIGNELELLQFKDPRMVPPSCVETPVCCRLGLARMANSEVGVKEEPDGQKSNAGCESATISLRLLLLSTLVLVLSILLAEGDGMPAASPGEQAEAERLARAPEVSPYRGDGPFRVFNTTHGFIPTYAHTWDGWKGYIFGGIVSPLATLVLGYLAFGRDGIRILQLFELVQTVGMISHGALYSYPRFPVPTTYHGTGSSVAALTRRFLFLSQGWVFPGPVLAAAIFGRFQRTRFLVDVIGVFYALLDMWPSLIGEFHVNERPTHNLRLLVLSLGSMASRHRAWGAIMGMFYIGTGGPKLFPSFYRYWLWFGIYPSSTLADFPPSLFFRQGEDGGWHPNFLAQAFGFFGGALEVTFAVLILIPVASTRRLRALLASAIHLGIIFGRFDNGLCGWNSFWLIEDVLHSLGPLQAGWPALSPLPAAVVAAQGTFELLFFLGHGSYHSGMSHHTGNFRMQWLLFGNESSWQTFQATLAGAGHGEACQHGPLHGLPTCVHSWGHGTHYPTASFGTFLYALNGGTYLQEVLPLAVAKEEEGFGPNLESLGQHLDAALELYRKERALRTEHHEDFVQQVEALVGGLPSRPRAAAGPLARAVYLGFASGTSVWDDSFYEPVVADLVRESQLWRPGEVLFIELDRQRPWRRTRRLRTWDLSRELPETPRSLVDRLLGSSPRACLVEDRRIVVRHPFPFT